MKKLGRMLQWLIIILVLIVGLCLVFNKQISSFLVDHDTNQVLNKPIQTEKKTEKKKTTYNYEDVKPVGTADVIKERSQAKEVAPDGKIAIPSIQLLLPIMEGTTNQNMSIGAGTLKPNQTMGKGNYALASHNMNDYKTLFSPLLNIKVGALVYLTNGKNNYTYKVTRKEYINPDQIEVIEDKNHDKEVTLITCSLDGKQRLLVQGKLVGQSKGVSSYFQSNS